MNVAILLGLTNTSDDTLVNAEAGAFSDALKAALAKRREEKQTQAADSILEVLRLMDSNKDSSRIKIRELRAAIQRETKRLDDLDLAWLYAQDTNDFGPILSLLGSLPVSLLTANTNREVPKDYKPSEARRTRAKRQ